LARTSPGLGLDDPDPVFYENYACGSVRNYTRYCNEEIMRLMNQQSQELDATPLVSEIEKDGAPPTLG
jgi:peptide/nickel transport system substrate-binding protein